MSPRSRHATVVAMAVVVLVGAAAFVASRAFAPAPAPGATTAAVVPTPVVTETPVASATPRVRTPGPTTEVPVSPSTTPPSTPTPLPSRTRLTVSYFGYDTATTSVRASGYVDVIEAGGACTLTLTSGGKSATGSSRASADASTTSCGELQIPRSALSPGVWDGILAYASPATVAQSQPFTVTVP